MQYVLFLDLKDDPKLIEAYEAHHRNVWPEVIAHIRDCGIEDMKIYRRSNRLVMLMKVNSSAPTMDGVSSMQVSCQSQCHCAVCVLRAVCCVLCALGHRIRPASYCPPNKLS